MNTFFVDESGSMTKNNLKCKSNQYFVICIIMVDNPDRVKRVLKRFIKKNLNNLKAIDKQQRMFYKDGRFKELKGSSLNKDMKLKLVDYLCQNHLFDVFYICVNNRTVEDVLYQNTARAFNYLLRLSIEFNSKNNLILKDINYLYIDERNVKTNSKATLNEYLNIELVIANHLQKTFIVSYCKSENNTLIQLADFFSNLYYSYIICGSAYDEIINKLRRNQYIKNEFIFPFTY